MGKLEGKVVAVTGAGRGIGREIALECARQGAAVVVNDVGGSADGEGRDAGPAEQVAAEIKAMGGRAVANFASVADPAGAESIINDGITKLGGVHGVVNNAGILRDRIFHKMSHAEWKEVIDVHLHGTFNVTKAAANYFKDQGGGAYVHFTSTSGLIGNIGQANYAAAKMGIIGLSTSIALDMQRFGVRSNCVAPFAWSRMIAGIAAETEVQKERIERIKSMTPQKIAPLIAYLITDDAKDVSSQVFCVRKNEIFLFNNMRPIRAMQRENGWTVDSIATDLMPAFRPSMPPLQRSSDVFSWDPA
ncbi:MAG: SDR family NAD(P)-dependent oxidoreductase [Pseudomonadota bacterium]